jgi:cyclic beta-1,2-glucan synthetase
MRSAHRLNCGRWAAMAFAALGDRRRAWDLYSIINPVNHGRDEQAIAKHKVEPYVAAADVNAVAPHTGRGGWTWYTGSAGWLYRLILESLLGLTREAGHLRFEPCLPAHWPSISIDYRFRETTYHITMLQTDRAAAKLEVRVDGIAQADATVPLVDDGLEHRVTVLLPVKEDPDSDDLPLSAAAMAASPPALVGASPFDDEVTP